MAIESSPLQQLRFKYEMPRLWIEKIQIYAEVKSPGALRTIDLQPGINVIWAKEQDPEEGNGKSLFGHGVGKTSFCRLLRYCLGEDSFGDPEHEKRVRETFPDGAVVALIHLADEIWSVCRPFGDHKISHAVQGDFASLLLSAKANQYPYDDFLRRLESELLKDLPSELPGSGSPVRWEHLLGWCARDQEAHLAAFTAWRAGETVNATAKFRRPTQDPPNLVRAVLGLLDQEEFELLNEQSRLQQQGNIEKQKIEELEKEPHYWHHEILKRLTKRLELDQGTPIDSEDLFAESISLAVQNKNGAFARHENEISTRLKEIDAELRPFYAKQQALDEERMQFQSILDFWRGEASNLQSDIDRPIKEREKLRNLHGTCRYGMVDFQKCRHILDFLNLFDMRDTKDVLAAKKRLTDLLGDSESIENKKSHCEELLKKIAAEISDKEKQRRALILMQATSQLEQKSLRDDWDSLLKYDEIIKGRNGDERLDEARNRANEIEVKHKSSMGRLSLLKLQRNDAERNLEKIWNACLHWVVGRDAYGKLFSEDGSRPFRLLSHNGRAMRALEIVLGDWASLIHSVAGDGHLPGFLLHDCPREADMGASLYRTLLDSLAKWQKFMSRRDTIPFQYILTTTTPPPESLCTPDILRLELDGNGDNGYLFKTRLRDNELIG